MPIEPLPSDQFTRGHLLFGLPVVEFTPALAAGGFGVPVLMGILGSASLEKTVETIKLNRGDSGPLTVDREVVSLFEPELAITTFNFKSDAARYVFGSDVVTAIIADAAAQITDEEIVIQTGADAARVFLDLDQADVDDTPANLTLTCAPIAAETVTNVTGDGTTAGDYKLAFKPLVLGDVTLLRELDSSGALVRTFVPQAGAPAGATEAQLVVGLGATSGELTFFQAVQAGNTIEATYTPSHDLEEDVDAASPDMILDPFLGRIRFPNLDSFAVPDGTSALRQGQGVLLDYQYNRKSGVTFQPGRQNQVDGKMKIKLLSSPVGSNFVWTVPSATILQTDDALEFSSESFATGSLRIKINDAGGQDRFGSMVFSNEAQAAA